MMRKAINLAIGLAVAVICAYFAFKGVSLAELRRELANVKFAYLAPYPVFFLLMLSARAVRWGILLKPMGKIGAGRVFAIAQVGFMAIVFLPLRIGEFVRPYLVSQESDIPMSKALASVVVERVVDGLSVGILLVLSMISMGGDRLPPEALTTCYFLLAVFSTAVVFLVLLVMKRRAVVSIVESVVGKVSSKAARKVADVMSSFIEGAASLPGPRDALIFLGLTVFYWVLNGLTMYILMLAFGFGDPPYSLPLVSGYIAMAILVGFIMLPTAPGFAGNFEVALVVALRIFGIGDSAAMSYALILHAMQTIFLLFFGCAFLLSGSVSFSKAMKATGLGG